jgi:hypothetical protein
VHLYGPGGMVDLSGVRFEQHDPRTVKVSGSRFVPAPYTIKLEGSKRVGYRTICVAGVRDPGTIRRLDELIREAKLRVGEKFGEHMDSCNLMFHVYGRDGVMGELEPHPAANPHEVGIVIEAVAQSQALATGICGYAHTIMLHYGFRGRISTAGNLAFPFSPLDIPAGPVYEFNIYHLVEEDDPCRLFPMDIIEV